MINLNFFFWNFIILYIYLYIEIFYHLVFYSIFKNLKKINIELSKRKNFFNFNNNFFQIILNLLLVYFITFKLLFLKTNIFFILVLFLIFFKFNNLYLYNNLMFLNINIILSIFLILHINSITVFFILIELYSILFYFFFLNVNKVTNISILKLKNTLLLYLFNNFFTTILFLLGINFIVEIYGSVNFYELLSLNSNQISIKLYLIVIAFILKLALPGLHYLKLEIYKYLDFHIVIYFSLLTIIINYLFTIYFFSFNFINSILINFKLVNILLLLCFFFFIQKIKINNFCEFISYSGFATNNLILLNFII